MKMKALMLLGVAAILSTMAFAQDIILSNWAGTNAFRGALIVQIRTTTTSPVTVTIADYFICVNTASGATAVNLPPVTAASTGLTFLVKDCTGVAATGGRDILITPAAGLIDGAATYDINVNFASVAVTYNGTSWFIN